MPGKSSSSSSSSRSATTISKRKTTGSGVLVLDPNLYISHRRVVSSNYYVITSTLAVPQ